MPENLPKKLNCSYFVNSGTLLQSSTSTSKSISDPSGIGSPPNGAYVKAVPQTYLEGQSK